MHNNKNNYTQRFCHYYLKVYITSALLNKLWRMLKHIGKKTLNKYETRWRKITVLREVAVQNLNTTQAVKLFDDQAKESAHSTVCHAKFACTELLRMA